MRRGSRLATRRWRASTSRATSSTRSGTTPSLHTRHNTPHVALNCACVLRAGPGENRDPRGTCEIVAGAAFEEALVRTYLALIEPAMKEVKTRWIELHTPHQLRHQPTLFPRAWSLLEKGPAPTGLHALHGPKG